MEERAERIRKAKELALKERKGRPSRGMDNSNGVIFYLIVPPHIASTAITERLFF